MPTLRLAHTHKAVREYYASLRRHPPDREVRDGTSTPAFAALLEVCAEQLDWTLVQQYELTGKPHRLCVDGVLLDRWALPHGFWEASDELDDLALEAKKKIDQGYPSNNTLFQTPSRILLYRNGQRLLEEEIIQPQALVEVLKEFFGYRLRGYEQWEQAAAEFEHRIPQLAQALLHDIAKERLLNLLFFTEFSRLVEVCRQSLGPSLSEAAVEKLLVQHILTRPVLQAVFDNPGFFRTNPFARKFEQAAALLRLPAAPVAQVEWSHRPLLPDLDRFCEAIHAISSTVGDLAAKQQFLTSIYESLFQGFDVRTVAAHGTVHTPPSIVRFMVRSINTLLQEEFGQPLALASHDIHVLDPFAGTGSFILDVMRRIPRDQLPAKYESELHANEVMLLPYYLASMTIEHEYAESIGEARPFQGLYLADTFSLAEAQKQSPDEPKTLGGEQVERQRHCRIKVILGNPPYDAWQLDEDARNRDRRYPMIDLRINETYAKDSVATLLNSLNDLYVKAFRWASDHLEEEGVLAYVSDSSYLTQPAFDGMRKHLAQDFDVIYLLDLGGNVRKDPRLSSATHNVFGLQLGICIGLFVRRRRRAGTATIFYARTEDDWRREQKYRFLDKAADYRGITWMRLESDDRHTWLTKAQPDPAALASTIDTSRVHRTTSALGPRDPRLIAAALDTLDAGLLPVEALPRRLRDPGALGGVLKNLDIHTLIEECTQLRWVEVRSGRLALTSEGRHAAEAGRASPHRFAWMLCLNEYHRDTVTQLLWRLWELNPQHQGAVLLPVPEIDDDPDGVPGDEEARSTRLLQQHWEVLLKNLPGLHRAPSAQLGPTGFGRTNPRLRRQRLMRWIEDQTLELLFGDICSVEATRAWQTRTAWAGLTVLASNLRGIRGRVWFPVGVFRDTDRLGFVAVPELRTNRVTWYRHVPEGPQIIPKFIEELFEAYRSFSAADGREYVSLMAVRDTVCYQLRLSQELFQRLLEQSLSSMTRSEIPYSMSLEVDITPQQRARLGSSIPIVIDGIPRYIIAMSSKQQPS